MNCKVAGIKFAVDANPELALARPEGAVELKNIVATWEDRKTGKEMKDELAVEVHWDGKKIGFLPASGKDKEVRGAVHEYVAQHGEMPQATIERYAYSTGGNNFNDDHDGILASALIGIQLEEVREGDFEHYKKDGKVYERASTVLDCIKLPGFERLIMWMINTFSSHGEYEAFMENAADGGKEKHDGLETACNLGIIGCGKDQVESIVRKIPQEEFDKIPKGFWNFVANETEGLLAEGVEQTVYNDEHLIAGTYDLKTHRIADDAKIIIDWKSSKNFYCEHIVKTCFYGHEERAAEVWIVIFGVNTAKGYRVKKITDQKVIKAGHDIVCMGRKLMELFKVVEKA